MHATTIDLAIGGVLLLPAVVMIGYQLHREVE